MYINRIIEDKLNELSEHFPAIMVSGARQVGKTTLLKKYAKEHDNINYVTLDYPRLRELAKNDPELFLHRYSYPLIIDEIQYAPELLPHIKIKVDETNYSGQYFFSGSQMFHMMDHVSESLAGRCGILQMYSLSNAEIEGNSNKAFNPKNIDCSDTKQEMDDTFAKILKGGMPRLIADSAMKTEDFYNSYVQTYIERDIKHLINVKNEGKFLRFLSCAAARVAQELNLADIAKDLQIDRKTAESWMSLLVSSGIAVLLSPYFGNTIKRIVKRPKLYFMDSGLTCFLSRWNNARALEVSAMAGAMFENYLVSEIIKSYTNQGIDIKSRLMYYRDNNGKEIDLLIYDNGTLYPIEIKKNSNPGKNAIKNFSVLTSFSENIGEGGVLCRAPMVMPIDANNKIIPISVI